MPYPTRWQDRFYSSVAYPVSPPTIFQEHATITAHTAYPGRQYHLSLEAPKTAAHAQPGQFIHLQCDPLLPMRRPMSIMASDAQQQSIDILYKSHGQGSHLLAQKRPGDTLDLLGPIGVPFKLSGYRPHPLLIGGGVGIPPILFLSRHIQRVATQLQALVLMGSEVPFPFKIKPSKILLPDMPNELIASIALLDELGIASRLASQQDYAGCYPGYVTDIARLWLERLDPKQHDAIEIFACGPPQMLKATAKLAEAYHLPCQIALEEHMACAVGACAGCVVPIYTHPTAEPVMKRICVDGPVFEANTVYPPSSAAIKR